MAAENRNTNAMNNLGILYEDKDKNIVEAKKWY